MSNKKDATSSEYHQLDQPCFLSLIMNKNSPSLPAGSPR